jgi:hypothetical protein
MLKKRPKKDRSFPAIMQRFLDDMLQDQPIPRTTEEWAAILAHFHEAAKELEAKLCRD